MKTLHRSAAPLALSKSTMLSFMVCTALLLARAGMAQVTPGQAVSLNGVQQYCTMVENTDVTGEFTVEAWVRADPTTNRVMSIFSSRYNADFSFDMKLGINTTGNSTILADIGNGSAWLNTAASITYKIERSRWYHIAYTVSGSANQYIIYVNGRQVGSGAITAGTSSPVLFNSAHRHANIGKNESTNSEFFYGLMDEVRIYSRALSASEILGEATGSMSTTNRVKYFSFENASGNNFSSVLNSSDLLVYQGTGIFTANSYAAALCQANTATSISYNSFTANWSASPSGTVTNYAIDIATDPDFTELIYSYSVNVGTTSQPLDNLLAGTQYYYRVRANNNNDASVTGQGAYSNTNTFITLERATPGQAVALNGSNQYCTMEQSTPVTGEFTVEAWVRPDATSNRIMSIFSSRYAVDYSFDMKLGISADGNSSIQADIGNGSSWLNTAANVSYKLDGSRWYHIAYTVSGSANQYVVYVNGRQAGSGAITSGTSNPVLFNSNHLNANIGQNQIGGNEFFVGLIDEVRIYSRALSAAEMLGEANGSAISATGRVKYFNFENTRDNHFASVWNGADFLVYQGSSIFTANSYALILGVANAAGNIATASFTANWSAPAVGTPDNYFVDVSLLPDFSTRVVNSQSVNAGTTSLAITNLLANTAYYYRVRANNSDGTVSGQGAYSNTNSLTTSAQVDAGQAVALNGTNQYCTMAQGTPITGEFTVEAWVRSDATTNRVMNIFSSRYGAEYSFDMKLGISTIGNSTIQANIGNGTTWLNTAATASYIIEKSRWYHIAYTVSGSGNQYIVYVNGRQAGGGAITSGASTPVLFNSTHTNANIGQNQTTGDEFFFGLMDEVRIYNRVLSATEMLGEANGSLSATGRVKYFSFENATDNYFTSLSSGTDYLMYQGSSIFTAKSYALTLCQTNDATAITNTSFTANWSAPVLGAVTNYLVDVATEPTFSAQVVTGRSVTAGTTSVTITGLDPNKQYYYRVRANNTDAAVNEQGAYSNSVGVVTLGLPTIISFTPASQTYGGTVVITGTYFTPSSTVQFGGTPALSVVYNSANSLTATVGNGSSGNIVVTTLGGTATSGGFIYLPISITSFAPTAATYGNSITITGNNFLPGATVQFGGTPALSVVYNSATSLTATVGRGSSGAVTVVTTQGGSATTSSNFTYISSIYLVDSAKTGNTSATAVTSVNAAAWANACGNLQTALTAAAITGGQVWAKKGTYYPTVYPAGSSGSSSNRDFAFALKNGVAMYGGFAGTETDTSQRVTGNTSLLSGDIGIKSASGDNCYHVLFSTGNDNTCLINGFTITGGNANGTGYLNLNAIILQGYGGGLVTSASSPVISNCIFISNTASQGGGMYNQSGSNPIISNCTFSTNTGIQTGGAMVNSLSSPSITNSAFLANTSAEGGAMYNASCSPNIVNSVLSSNTSTINGGGGICNNSAAPTLVNCTFWSNNAALYGGGMLNTNGSAPRVFNSIFWGSSTATGPGIYNFGLNNTSNVSYNLVQGGFAGTGNTDFDPQFVNTASPAGSDGIFGNTDDGLRLKITSLAINAGNNDFTNSYGHTTVDITGAQRFQNMVVDLGAYEGGVCQGPFTRLYVDSANATPGNGSSWATAFTTLQQAMATFNSCNNGAATEIWVKKGTYYPAAYPEGTSNIQITERDYTLQLRNNLAIYGGFAGTETDISQRVVGNITILSGDIGTKNDNTDNCYHVIYANSVSSTAKLDGLTITGGNANGFSAFTEDFLQSYGGGIYNNGSSPTINNCLFTANNSLVRGGGMYNVYSAIPIITNCTFSVNTTSGNGGAMYNYSLSSTKLINCNFTGNTAGSGGAVYNNNSNSEITGCTFTSNVVAGDGGGINNSGSSPIVTSCIFSTNAASNGDGIFNISGSSPSIVNCSFSGHDGDGISNYGGTTTVTNCTFSGNSGAGISNVSASSQPTSIVTKSTFSNNGTGIYVGSLASLTADSCNFLANTNGINNLSTATLTNCKFYNNNGSTGAGLRTSQTSILTNCTFYNNIVNGYGGAIYNTSVIYMTNCSLYGNSASQGGGIYSSGSTTMTGCTVRNNSATDNGGGIYVTGTGYERNCAVYANTSGDLGGGIYSNGTNSIINGVLYNNTATNNGGGIYIGANSSNTIVNNCTLYANSTLTKGGGIFTVVPTTITNSIVWGNTANSDAGIHSDDADLSGITYNIVQTFAGGTANTSADPLFGNPISPAGADLNFGTTDDGLRLRPTSPAINTGNNAAILVSTDFIGGARAQGGTVDKGAYEGGVDYCSTYVPSILYVNSSANTNSDGKSWATPLKNLQDALYLSSVCTSVTEIRIAGGTYYPAGTAAGNASYRDSAFAIPRTGLKIYGGYNATTGLRDIVANPTILDGSGSSYHVLLVVNLTNGADSLVLDGLTVQGGKANGGGTSKAYNGVIILRNEGPGIKLNSNSGNNTIMVRNCTSKGNSGDGFGGGFYNEASSPTLLNCILAGNNIPNGGGMFNFNGSSPKLINTVITGNSSSLGGGIYNLNASSPTLTNCTISANTASTSGGMRSDAGCIPTVNNSIFYNNTSSSGTSLVSSSTITVKNSIIQGSGGSASWSLANATDGGSNLDASPSFAGGLAPGLSSAGNYSLLSCSPAINAGSNSLTTATADLAGNPRTYNTGIIDMGAYEYQGSQQPLGISLASITGTTGACNGKSISLQARQTGTVCATANEGSVLTIQAPAGAKFTAVVFASYGSPTGTCGNFAKSGCHAANSESFVSSQLLGNNIANIFAAAANFGDPCFGTAKRLYVEARYTYTDAVPSDTYLWSTTATTSFISPSPTVATAYTVAVTDVNGCVGNASLNISVLQPSISTTNLSVCPANLPYSWNGLSFTTAGSKTATLVNAAGCDSLATLNLTVNTGADLLAINGDVATISIVAAQGNMLMATSSACRTVANILPDNTASHITGSVAANVWLETTQPATYVKRHYQITPATNASTATGAVTLYFTQQEFTDFNTVNSTKLPIDATDAANNKANLLIEKHSGVSSNGSGLPATYPAGSATTITPTAVSWNSTVSRWEVTFNTVGFSGFFAKTQAGVLPVTLLSFTANLVASKTVALQWNVAEQVGIRNYVVERSADGSSFGTIGSVAANNLTATNYTYTDANLPTVSTLYYRLKIIGVDGTVTYSSIVTVRLGGSNLITIYPNPAKDYVWLQGGSVSLIGTDAFVTDMQGRIISKTHISAWPLQINTSTLSNGVYSIRLNNNQTLRLVIGK